MHAQHGTYMVAGADNNCAINTYTSDDGSAWITQGSPPANWWTFVPGGQGSTLESGAGIVDLGCTVISLSTVQVSKVFAGCDNGTVLATNDRVISWNAIATLTGLVDLAFLDQEHAYALTSVGGCASNVLATNDGGISWAQVACLGQSQPSAIAAIDSMIAVATTDTIWTSPDNGKTWSA